MSKIKVAILGSGNIGTDLMIKVMRHSAHLEMGVVVEIAPASEGLNRASRMGVAVTDKGIDGLIAMPEVSARYALSELNSNVSARGLRRR
jgi:acetaldehyde dehydrogenase